MNFAMSFVFWAVVGALIGRLAQRSEPRPAAHSYPYVTLGIVGGVLGGLLWFPGFAMSPGGQSGIFNLFSASFGFIGAFWVMHIVHLVRENTGSQN